MKQYAERDIMSLDKSGGYYCRHIWSMTSEQLHSKSDIAAELGHRDMVIAELLDALQEIMIKFGHMGDASTWSISESVEGVKARDAIAKALGE